MNSKPIFGIGLNKTGTQTLAEAFRLLGKRAWHFHDPAYPANRLHLDLNAGNPLPFDFLVDNPLLHGQPEYLARRYPGSRFIVTFRDVHSWIDSRLRHMILAREKHRKGRRVPECWLRPVDESRWQEEWRKHHLRMRTFTEGQPAGSVLWMNITQGDDWDVLCPWLGEEAPSKPFPRLNKSVDLVQKPDPQTICDMVTKDVRPISKAIEEPDDEMLEGLGDTAKPSEEA